MFEKKFLMPLLCLVVALSLSATATRGANILFVSSMSEEHMVGDDALKTFMEGLGHTVTYLDDDEDEATTEAAAAAADMVFISESCGSGNIKNEITELEVPMIVGEPWAWDEMGLTEGEGGDDPAVTTDVEIVDPGHYVAAGLSGTVAVLTDITSSLGGCNLGKGLTGPEATVIATATLSDGQIYDVIFVYEKGAALPVAPADGSAQVAADIRIGFGFHLYCDPVLNENAYAMLGAAVDYALGLAGSAMAQIDPATVETGHVYLLEDVVDINVPDDSANDNTGTIVGDPQVVEGLKGKALQFDGVDDGIDIPDSNFINVTGGPWPNRTVIAVFKCDDVTKQEKQTVFEEGGLTRGLTIYVFDGEVYVGGWNKSDYEPQWNPGSWLSAPINSNQWYAVALVIRDGTPGQEDDKFEMWMDGNLIGKAPGAEIWNHGNDNAIGYTNQNVVFHDGDGSGDGWFFEGAIDELWILNDALTETELGAWVGAGSAALPEGWQSQDIGTTGGSAAESDGTWVISADGADVWGSADEFHYVYMPLSGDGTIIARVVDNGTGSNTWAKGGVMIRETLDQGSKHAIMALTGGSGAGMAFQLRPETDSSDCKSSHDLVPAEPPYWVKLTRVGNTFTGYSSADGVEWLQQPTRVNGDGTEVPVDIEMAADVYIGLFATSHAAGEIRTYTFDNVRVVLPDVTAPGDAIQGVPNDGDWPGAETPDLAIDDNIETKYLHFKGDFDPDPGTGGAGFQVTPATGPSIVTGLTLTTANDVPGRDPIAFELSGSNDSIDGPYELIASGDIVDFVQETEWPRFTMNATPISFKNDTAYAHYQLIFTAIRGPVGGSVNSMQIAEVELLGELAPASPAGYWKFDEGSGTTAYDSSGNGLDGTLNGDPQWVEGQLGGALDFDGDDSVEIPHNPILSITDEITIAAWTYMRANASGELAIVSKGGWAANDLPYELTETPGSSIYWQFYDDGGRDTCAPQSPPVEEWHHIAGTYDGNIFKCYIDGVLADEWAYAGTMPENTAPVTIGQRSRGGCYFNGMIDEVRIYDVALTAEEVAALAQ